MAVIYENFLAGQISDAPLSDSATTINSAGFAALPEVVAPDTMWLTLDPLGSAGLPEMVQVTAHAPSATSVAVVRARQDTVARSHALNTVWHHSWTRDDAEGVASLEERLCPAGTVRASITASAEPGWEEFGQTITGCDALYPTLWAKLPAAWKSGSDAVLPSMDDVGLFGAGTVAALTVLGGANTITLAEAQLPAHTHTGSTSNAGSHTHTGSTDYEGAHQHSYFDQPNSSVAGGSGSTRFYKESNSSLTGLAGGHSHTVSVDSAGAHTHTVTIGSTGSGDPVPNVQRSLGVVWKIKAH